jgi:O-antigen/teichoic acid export membrane protein
VDNLLVGRFLGAAALGAYSIAYNVMLTPFSRIAGPIQEVLFPAFSRMQDDPRRLTAVWVRVTRVVGAVSMPALLGLMVVAPDFIHVVLGPRWSAAAPVLQILVWVGLLQSLQTLNGDILVALDRTGTLFRYSVVFFCVHLTAFAIGLRWGIVGVAAGYAVTTTLVEPLYTWVTARALGVGLRELVGGLAGVAQAAAAMLACVLAARVALVHEGASPLVRLAVCVAVGAAVYVPTCALRAPELVAEVRGLRRKAPPAAEPPVVPLLTPERAL